MCCSFIDDMHLIEMMQAEKLVPMKVVLNLDQPDCQEIFAREVVKKYKEAGIRDTFWENQI